MQLDSRLPDPFAPYARLERSAQQWFRLSLFLLVVIGLLSAGLVLVALRPPQVIVKDRVFADAPIVTTMATAPPITLADARAYFVQMLRLRYGWTSLTVSRDLETYLSQCTETQRRQELTTFEAPVPAAKGSTPRPSGSRLQYWVEQHIQNSVLLPESLEDVTCKQQARVWHCYLQGGLVTGPLLPHQGETQSRVGVTFVGALVEVPHTIRTPSGLIVGELRDLPHRAAISAQKGR